MRFSGNETKGLRSGSLPKRSVNRTRSLDVAIDPHTPNRLLRPGLPRRPVGRDEAGILHHRPQRGPDRRPDSGVYSIHDPSEQTSRVDWPGEEKEMKASHKRVLDHLRSGGGLRVDRHSYSRVFELIVDGGTGRPRVIGRVLEGTVVDMKSRGLIKHTRLPHTDFEATS